MAARILGIQPLKFGTTTISGYVVETITETETGGEVLIEDEGGNYVSVIGQFARKTEVSIEVIPKTGTTTPPEVGDTFAYGSKEITMLQSVETKEVNKDVTKWILKGLRFTPAISSSGG